MLIVRCLTTHQQHEGSFVMSMCENTVSNRFHARSYKIANLLSESRTQCKKLGILLR